MCKNFITGFCGEGHSCQFKHTYEIKDLVCRFFLTNECKKGSVCSFLHEIIPEKLPECRSFITGECVNTACKFKHNTEKKGLATECMYYNAGFCPKGKFCKFRHARKLLCTQYFKESCAEPSCTGFHIDSKFFESVLQESYKETAGVTVKYSELLRLCWRCMQFGHIPLSCPAPVYYCGGIRCYKCSGFGHKSNSCPQYYLS